MKNEWTIGGLGYCLVEVESRYENKTGFKGVDQKELIIDTRYEPLKYAKTFGKVVQVPYAMGARPIRQIPIGFPAYGPRNGKSIHDAHAALYAIGGYYKWNTLNDIAPEVMVGDTIWFNRLVLHQVYNIVDEFDRDGAKVYVFKVEYDLIICIEKDDGPLMIGGWCFLEPQYESWQKHKIPMFYETKDKHGRPIPKPESEWFQIALQPPQEKLRATLKHFGKPLRGDVFDFGNNADVFIRKQIHWRYMYKGSEFMLCYQWDIYAEVVDDPYDGSDINSLELDEVGLIKK